MALDGVDNPGRNDHIAARAEVDGHRLTRRDHGILWASVYRRGETTERQ